MPKMSSFKYFVTCTTIRHSPFTGMCEYMYVRISVTSAYHVHIKIKYDWLKERINHDYYCMYHQVYYNLK